MATSDFDDKMTCSQAIALTKEVGDNWRLPTKEEFEMIVTQTPTIQANMNLYKGGYWTSSQQGDYAWQSSFEFGFTSEYYSKNNYAYVLLLKK